MVEKEKQPYGTVLIKAAGILDFLSSKKEPQALNIIAQETGLTSSTALKILDTLLLIGYVKKHAETKKFELGSGLIKYAHQYLSNLDISKIAYPYLKEMQLHLDETVHLGILEGDEILTVNKLESQKSIVCTNSKIGLTKQLYCTAMGKAVLAELPENEVIDYLNRVELQAITENTITNPNELLMQLKEIKRNGYAIDDNEAETEVYCLGVSLYLNEYTYGAFSVSVPSYRITPEVKEDIVQKLLKTKDSILRELQQKYVFI
ncbi:IclR family transcriptional regulator [Neobacillus drentensis]|uniref:IclR family transcriptional regulator n=1 Tax=Neobacillus drentensis TaxID=220684 RepID=UPI001F2C65B2|nr:IclR family transcriptional regulator [Neobacillus drentensis]ULT56091.1 IclR family transcriptional regulator [Neobacillus drentensis]